MEWLRVIALGCLLCIWPGALWGQSKAANSAGAGSFTVVGDVERPGNYRFEETLTVRSAVAVSSPVSDAVNVTVLRNGHDRAQSTRLLRLSSVDSGELAMSGDIYVVESLAVMSRPVLSNAVVRSGTFTTVVSLEDSGVVIGDVLRGLGIPCDGETRVSLPCRIHGLRAAESVAVSASVRHGDVISLGSTVAAADYGSTDGYSGMRPLVSEWSSAVRPVGAGTAGVRSGGGPGMVRSESRLQELPAVPFQKVGEPELPAVPFQKVGEPELPAVPFQKVGEPELAAVPFRGSRAPELPAVPVHDGDVPKLPVAESAGAAGSDGRVVIVGEGREHLASGAGREEVLLLSESLRPRMGTDDSGPNRDRVSVRGNVRTGKSVTGGSSRPPISAAVSTRTESDLSRDAGVDSARGVHWAVIAGLFVAGVWVLGRSLLLGGTVAAAERSMVGVIRGEQRGESAVPGAMSEATVVGGVGGCKVSASPEKPAKSVVAEGVDLAGGVPAATTDGQPWRIYSVPRSVRRGEAGQEADDLELLIENRIPVERGEARIPESLQLTGRSVGRGTAGSLRVDGPHAIGEDSHLSGGDMRLRRGRRLEDRLSQLIRAIPTGIEESRVGKSAGVSAGAAGAEQ